MVKHVANLPTRYEATVSNSLAFKRVHFTSISKLGQLRQHYEVVRNELLEKATKIWPYVCAHHLQVPMSRFTQSSRTTFVLTKTLDFSVSTELTWDGL